MVLNGIDISHWQTADASKNVAYDFMICKATEGTGYVDALCNTHYANAKARGKLLGLYHFARADLNPGTAGAIKEADYFLAKIANYVGEAALILDWEAASVAQGPAWAKAWLDRVYAKTGIRPWFYTYQSALKASYSVLTEYPLWLARYGANAAGGYRPNTATPSITPWKVITAFQYCSNGTLAGFSGRLDLDVFYGDAAIWRRLCAKPSDGGGSTPKPPSGPAKVTVTASLPIIDLSGGLPVSGKDVTALQGLLLGQWQGKDALGPNGYPDGIAGEATRDALKAFQAENGLEPDAICGAQTWAALLNQPRKTEAEMSGTYYASLLPDHERRVKAAEPDTQEIVYDDDLNVLPSVPDPGWDLGAIINVLPDNARRWIQGIAALLSLLVTITSGVVVTLSANGLMEYHKAFVTMTILSIIVGVLSTAGNALGFTSKTPSLEYVSLIGESLDDELLDDEVAQ